MSVTETDITKLVGSRRRNPRYAIFCLAMASLFYALATINLIVQVCIGNITNRFIARKGDRKSVV